jgi:hypothetical protein
MSPNGARIALCSRIDRVFGAKMGTPASLKKIPAPLAQRRWNYVFPNSILPAA